MNISNVGGLIDLGIVDYIAYVGSLSFSQANSTAKMLEMELGRIAIIRDQIYKGMETSINDPVKHDELSREFVQTYIAEQKIKDRIELAKKYVQIKGVQ
jgi:hypothetical protein